MGWRIHRAAAVAFVVLALMGGAAMALGGNFILASPIEGRLVGADGAARPGVRITRSWTWRWTGQTGADDAVTDAEGRFAFPAVEGSSLKARIPHRPDVLVELHAEAPAGAPRLLLSLAKTSYDLGSEAAWIGQPGPALRLRCDHDAEPSLEGVWFGACTAEEP